MTQEAFTHQYRGVEPTTIQPVGPNCSAPGIMTETDAGVAVQDGVRSSTMSQGIPVVFVVDEDLSVRRSLEALISDAGWRSETFASVREFLCCERVLVPNCLVVDIALLGLNGLDLQNRLVADRNDMPTIFVTDHGDVAMTVQAMKAGAFDFLTKPFRDDVLLGVIRQAIEHSRIALDHEIEIGGIRDCYHSLSRREQEVMTLVVSGLLNKQVGFELGISEITVKAHRGHMMQKMKAGSLAGLVRMAMKLGLSSDA